MGKGEMVGMGASLGREDIIKGRGGGHCGGNGDIIEGKGWYFGSGGHCERRGTPWGKGDIMGKGALWLKEDIMEENGNNGGLGGRHYGGRGASWRK